MKTKSNFILIHSDIPCEHEDFNDDDDDKVDKTEQTFNFVDVPSFVSFFSGSPNDSLYFVKVTDKKIASEIFQIHMAIPYLPVKNI